MRALIDLYIFHRTPTLHFLGEIMNIHSRAIIYIDKIREGSDTYTNLDILNDGGNS